MPKPLSIKINKNDVQITTDCFCMQLTYHVKRYRPEERGPNNRCQYEIHSKCIGTKVVNVKCGSDMYKCHDGCLKRISSKLGKAAKRNDEIIIEDDPVIVNKALTYIFNPKKYEVDLLTSKEKYDMVLFGLEYDFPMQPIKDLIDGSIYAKVVQYAWENRDLYLMEILPKMRIPNFDFVEDFKNVDKKIVLQFVRKYLEHKIEVKKIEQSRAICCGVFLLVLLLAFIAWCVHTSSKKSYCNNAFHPHY